MDSEPKVREVEGDNDVVDTSLGQAKGMANRIIDRVYEVGPNNLSIVEMCAVADSYSRIAQATLQQQQVQQLERIATATERLDRINAWLNQVKPIDDDWMFAHAPDPEPLPPDPPSEYDENDDDKPHYDTPGGW